MLIGAETSQQVIELVDLFKLAPLTKKEVEIVDATLPPVPDELTNPALWHENPSFAGSFNTGLLKDATTKD